MSFRVLTATLLVTALGLAGFAAAQDSGTRPDTSAKPQTKGKTKTMTDQAESAAKPGPGTKTEVATFGGGCFWCLEAVFQRIPGVKAVVSGYAGGNAPNPSYELVCTGTTGHAEVIQVEFDPEVLPYEKLLDVFWRSHDPTTLNQQGPDYGTQYRSIILYHGDAQKLAAQKSIAKLNATGVFGSPIVTEVVPLENFYPAEAYHQNYYNRHRYASYCQIQIAPKLRKLHLDAPQAKSKAEAKTKDEDAHAK